MSKSEAHPEYWKTRVYYKNAGCGASVRFVIKTSAKLGIIELIVRVSSTSLEMHLRK